MKVNLLYTMMSERRKKRVLWKSRTGEACFKYEQSGEASRRKRLFELGLEGEGGGS